jgi:uncharacterized protein (DUF697 family)
MVATETATNDVMSSTPTKEELSNKLISSASKWAAAATCIPLNGLDLVALASVQANLIVNISALYGEKPSKYVVSGTISTLLATLAPAYGAQLAVPVLLKWIPFGNLVGIATLAGFGAAATYAVGKVFVDHYENGGTFADFSATAASGELKSAFTSKVANS